MTTEATEVAAKPKGRPVKVTDTRPRVAWALFRDQAALSSGHTRIPAIAATEKVSIFIDEVHGRTVLSIEDPSLSAPGLIPWENVAAFGLVP